MTEAHGPFSSMAAIPPRQLPGLLAQDGWVFSAYFGGWRAVHRRYCPQGYTDEDMADLTAFCTALVDHMERTWQPSPTTEET